MSEYSAKHKERQRCDARFVVAVIAKKGGIRRKCNPYVFIDEIILNGVKFRRKTNKVFVSLVKFWLARYFPLPCLYHNNCSTVCLILFSHQYCLKFVVVSTCAFGRSLAHDSSQSLFLLHQIEL